MTSPENERATFAPAARVLLECDVPESKRVWSYALLQQKLEVAQAGSSKEALKLWVSESPDLILIDIHGPSIDVIELCKELRAEAVVPILVLTPNNNETHILETYRAGADECCAKPVSPGLFMAKTKAWLRRTRTVTAESLDLVQVNDFRLDPARREVNIGEATVIRLTNLEFRLLHLLVSHPGWVFRTDDIILRVWGYYGNGDRTLLKNVVYLLRRKIEPEPSHPRYIITESGIGYRFHSG